MKWFGSRLSGVKDSACFIAGVSPSLKRCRVTVGKLAIATVCFSAFGVANTVFAQDYSDRTSDHISGLANDSTTKATDLGDFDGDGDVDINDVRGLMSAIQLGESIDLMFDLNKDEAVTMMDARVMMSLCTRNRCAAN